MEEVVKLEKIEFIEQNLSFFMQRAHEKINSRDNVSTALLTILLSEKKLIECRNYPTLMEQINVYQGINFYASVIQIISNLQTYVMKIFNYDKEAQIITAELDQLIELYKNTHFTKVKRMDN